MASSTSVLASAGTVKALREPQQTVVKVLIPTILAHIGLERLGNELGGSPIFRLDHGAHDGGKIPVRTRLERQQKTDQRRVLLRVEQTLKQRLDGLCLDKLTLEQFQHFDQQLTVNRARRRIQLGLAERS
jgi:hypothetical protein